MSGPSVWLIEAGDWQRDRTTPCHSGLELNRDKIDGALVVEIEFFTIGRPLRVAPTISGELEFFTTPRKRPDVDFKSSGFIGTVSDPTAIGREAAIDLLRSWSRIKRFSFLVYRRESP